ncbi:membrane protein YfhO [Lutibacter sp. Hel_I_33_5]|uniref:YfhO family protein n=1 Tax=Lutibacter sp. Hel_I_33_5 TaxID=1566289 RepID=UPI0011A31F8E|nr:YfhO family protein [Lutibacter sp. Hel_I_33_5]TVZ55724.1 membrane protein YfhO [Lutibacter sp. Hel_I_33_5]
MKLKKWHPYLIAVLIFSIASVLYFSPVLQGKQIKQGDITQFIGMSKEIVDFRAQNKTEPYWTGSAFSGMPAYQLSAYFPNDFVRYVDKGLRFLPRPADYVFLYFLSFFILLTALKVEWKLAILGALAFGFSTYLIIIFGPGHNAKAHAIGYIPLVIAGVLWIYQKRYLLGFIVTGIAMSLEIYANHPQMTYYMGFAILILGLIEFYKSIKEKTIPEFAKQVGLIVLALLLGIATNSTRLLTMKEYADVSTRGKSELTISESGTEKAQTSGLDKAYITQFSYGIQETFNLFVPRYMGGGTVEELGKDTDFYKVVESKVGKRGADYYSKQALTYWGEQPIVEAPAYIGAVIFFLFFLGVFLVKGRLKYWLIATTIFSILLSWGKNFPILTNLFIDYFPLYNKFRAVSSIQVIAEFCVPLLAILGLKEFFSKEHSSEIKIDALKKAIYTFGGLVIVGLLYAFASSTFEGIRDDNYTQIPGLVDAIISERKSLLFKDSLRSLILGGISFAALWFFLKNKLKYNQVIIGIGILILFDLVSVNLRYVNHEDFVSPRKVRKPFTASNVDKEILKDKTHYRVANFTGNPMEDGRTSYFHKSIGGYHAAKMGRYQDLFDYQIAKNNIEVLNMLNTKYFILGGKEGDQVQVNPNANGNAWFVNTLIPVQNANEEIKGLDSLKTKHSAIINSNDNIKQRVFEKDSTATIDLVAYKTNHLTYKSKTLKEQFAVFSEIYYKNGWNAYVDGKLTPHFNVNYVLRGMIIPKGDHTIEFKFEPTIIQKGNLITLTSYALLLLIPLGWFLYEKKKR